LDTILIDSLLTGANTKPSQVNQSAMIATKLNYIKNKTTPN